MPYWGTVTVVASRTTADSASSLPEIDARFIEWEVLRYPDTASVNYINYLFLNVFFISSG